MIEKTTASYKESNNPNVNKSSKRKLLTDKENSATEDSREPRNKKGRTIISVFPNSESNSDTTNSKWQECKKQPLMLKTQLNNANVATHLKSEANLIF